MPWEMRAKHTNRQLTPQQSWFHKGTRATRDEVSAIRTDNTGNYEVGVQDRFVKVTAVEGVFFQILSSTIGGKVISRKVIGGKVIWRISPEMKLAALFYFFPPLVTRGAPCG